jgi:predicted nucleotidyltransferase
MHPEIDTLLDELHHDIRHTLGDRLIGLYLYGSLVSGGFIEGVSDVDLLAVTASCISDDEFRRLDAMHQAVVEPHPAWRGRLEIAYVSVRALRTFKTETSTIAVISPGEPFHFKEAGKEWLINWWLVRERGVTLYGPDPETLIPPISREEFLDQVWEHARLWRAWVKDAANRKGQSYARLTMCRALYAATHGEQVSKQRAARWAQAHLPEHAVLIDEALAWRVAEGNPIADDATTAATVAFVELMIAEVAEVLGRTA